MIRRIHAKILKGLSLGLSYQFFEYLMFWVWVWVFCWSLANFEKDNLKFKKNESFEYGFKF